MYDCKRDYEYDKALEELKPIGVHPLTNTGSTYVYSISEDNVVAGFNNVFPENCPVTEKGFYYGALFVPFDEVVRSEQYDT